jgi:competence protein ComEC
MDQEAAPVSSRPLGGQAAEPVAPRSFGDAGVAAGAFVVTVGAWWSPPVPLAVASSAVALALALRRPVLVVLAAGLLASALGHRGWAGTAPVPAGPWSGEATLMTDPEPLASGVRAIVEVDGARVEAAAFGAAARRLAPRLAGERVQIEGRLRPPQPDWAARLAVRHVRGRLAVEEVGAWRRGTVPSTVANSLRRLLERGAASLPAEQRSLLSGLVLGDDRYQSKEMKDAFAAAGLTHLLAVSGQNVAFVLLAVSPLLRRVRIRARLLGTVAVLAFFALLTRFEPSVLRATTMAGAAALASTVGRPTSRLRALALALSGLLLVDPLLAHSLGFQLSVAATAGIVLLGPRIAALIPGPRWVALPLSVTLAAQLATAPLIVATFGPVPLASVPANLLAAPAAGAVMTYGLAVGTVAGLCPPVVAGLLHLPTGLMLWWVAAVARRAAALPLPTLGWRGISGAVGLGLVAEGARRRRARAAATVTVVAGTRSAPSAADGLDPVAGSGPPAAPPAARPPSAAPSSARPPSAAPSSRRR